MSADATLASLDPYFSIDTSTETTLFGAPEKKISIDNTATISTTGSDIDVPLNFDTKGGGNFIFKGGTNVNFVTEDGSGNETFNIDTLTGDITLAEI